MNMYKLYCFKNRIQNFLEYLIPKPNVSTLNYNPAFDGIRAVAVLLVILNHYFPGKFKFGYLGVDIFFTLSGFLIASIIFQKLENNTFTFKNFYRNRIRRLFPALTFLLLFSLVFGYLYIPSIYYKSIGLHIFTTGFYIQNFELASEIGYFDIERIYKPFLHTWSLAVEEQFYLFFPLLLFFIYKIRKNLLFVFIIFIVLFSFIFSLMYFKHNPSKAYYISIGRFWEFGLGILIAYFIFKIDKIKQIKFFLNLKVTETTLLILSFFVAFNFLREYNPVYLFIYLDIANFYSLFTKRKKYIFYISYTLFRENIIFSLFVALAFIFFFGFSTNYILFRRKFWNQLCKIL